MGTPKNPRSCRAPSRNRTCNPRLRRPVLYPIELWAQTLMKHELRLFGPDERSRDTTSPLGGERSTVTASNAFSANSDGCVSHCHPSLAFENGSRTWYTFPVTLSIQIPEATLRALGPSPSEAEGKVRLAAAMKLHELGTLSAGAAADLAGIPKVEFLHKLADFGVEAFRVTPDEFDQDQDMLRRSLG